MFKHSYPVGVKLKQELTRCPKEVFFFFKIWKMAGEVRAEEVHRERRKQTLRNCKKSQAENNMANTE